MSKQPHHASSSPNELLPWWIRLSRWLWKGAGFLGISVFLALGVNVASTRLTTSQSNFLKGTPLDVLMTNWPISLLVGCCLFLLALVFWAIGRFSPPPDTMTQRARNVMLKRLRMQYTQSFAQSLQGAVQIELELATRPTAIHNALSLSLHLPEQPEQMLPAHTSIVTVYEQAQEELLILGEPGAGKSTLLLELAQYLVTQAEQDETQPLPVLIPLSSWATKQPHLHDWIIEQFALLYDVPRRTCSEWIQVKMIFPLLDGLDEMEDAARASCIAAINTYRRDYFQPLIVCSRTSAYETAARDERLTLHSAIVVQPLTIKQVDTYLAAIGKPVTALRSALKKNAMLQTLATTPLMLQILILTYHGISVRTYSQKESQLREQVWTDYVQHMVSRKGNKTRYPLEQTCVWLRWLAQHMRDHNQTIFSLEQLSPHWLSRGRRMLYRLNVKLVFGLIYGLVCSWQSLTSGSFHNSSQLRRESGNTSCLAHFPFHSLTAAICWHARYCCCHWLQL